MPNTAQTAEVAAIAWSILKKHAEDTDDAALYELMVQVETAARFA